jgi:hypothetical protein
MRITRIDIEGRESRYATITRRKGCRWIEVTIITPCQPDGKDHRIAADADESELWNQARNLQHALDGVIGTTRAIDGYYRELQRFAD